jgi:hypothetical protein
MKRRWSGPRHALQTWSRSQPGNGARTVTSMTGDRAEWAGPTSVRVTTERDTHLFESHYGLTYFLRSLPEQVCILHVESIG